MRTFIAIEPPEDIRRRIGRLGHDMESNFPGVRWSRPETVHLTLRFLGEIEMAQLEDLKAAVSSAASGAGSLRLRISHPGWFGSQRNPRVIWLGLEDNPDLMSLAGRLELELESSGFGRADKPFKAHLTLARIKNPLPRPPVWATLKQVVSSDWPDWIANRVEVIKSKLTPEGPHYETLADIPLD